MTKVKTMNKELYYNTIAKLGELRYKVYFNTVYPYILKHRAKMIGKKDKIEVVFFAMNIAMWRYQGIYDLLSKDERFNCHVVFTVALTFTKEQQSADLKQMRAYFDERHIRYKDYDEVSDLGYDVLGKINPDILFYPQPYDGAFPDCHCYRNFLSKLLCYVPYGLTVGSSEKETWVYNTMFHCYAWKLFYPFAQSKNDAKKISWNYARNMVISGYSRMDSYLSEENIDVWKIQDRRVKRLIWAPHFTISLLKDSPLNQSNFLRIAELMLELAKRYKDRLQIAFKPHPRLKTELYRHPDWGQERTDNYYHQWESMANTQLETGDFVDLFKTSDAMIHDSASFTLEYLYVNKPVAFVTSTLEGLFSKYSSMGVEALKQHYLVTTEDEIISFIEDVVLGGKDTKQEQRTRFFNTQLAFNQSMTTSQFVVQDIMNGLGLKQ